MRAHTLLQRASEGELPAWACVSPPRREHLARVAELMASWCAALGQGAEERRRWLAAGFLHDALRDGEPELLRPWVPPALRDLPDLLLHGPAAAERLWVDGVRDGAFLRAVAYHTLGHPQMDAMGRFLYAADFLEPGRPFLDEWRGELRERMPADAPAVLRAIVGARIAHRVEQRSRVRPETVAFWNVLAQEA